MRVDLKSHFKMFMNRAKYGDTKKSEKEKKHFFRFVCLFVCFLKETVSIGPEWKRNILAMALLREWISRNYGFTPFRHGCTFLVNALTVIENKPINQLKIHD